jgi:5-methylcytosine-specific restriction endonuclease McrA
MKNLKPYNEDCFYIHESAVNKKQTGDLKDRLLNSSDSIKNEYLIYEQKFDTKQLHLLLPSNKFESLKDDLATLYSYQNSVIRKVRTHIESLQVNTIITTCQNCTIDTVHTLDHILPQSKFPEFIVNPKNLFPCCSTCNSYKLNVLPMSTPIFLNLYLDKLPDIQYLFVDIKVEDNDNINFNFHLQNIDNLIDNNLYSTITTHYEKLNLFYRMKLKSIEFLSEFEIKIRTFKKVLNTNQIIEILNSSISDERAAYGFNHWKCVLEHALLNSTVFMNRFE